MPPSYCSVAGCSNCRSPTCSLYCFPKDDAVCKQWVEFCNRPELWKKYEENGPEYLYKSSRICSDHFQPNDFNNPNLFSQGLKKGSVPTLYPASKEPKSRFSIGGFSGGNSPPNGQHQPDHDSLILSMSTKRPLPAHQQSQPVAKRRSLPPAATSAATLATHAAVSGALAGLIQRQQLKEQQRKAFAAALQLQAQQLQQQQQQNQQPRSLLASSKQKTNNNNNNNTIISNLNGKSAAAAAAQEKLEDERGYGINYVDMDGGDSSEYDSSYQAEDELVAYKQLQQMKAVKAAAAVIPASLKSELTVTAAVNHNNNNNNNSKEKDGIASSNGTIDYKEKYEQTMKELFACRKIVKNQNNAIKQLQGEIDFLNQLLKEK